MSEDEIRVRVHAQDDPRLAHVTRLTELSTQRRPITALLDAMCREARAVLRAGVVSVYLREADLTAQHAEDLVMRGNVGLSGTVVGQVRFPLGEGIAGLAAESATPVSFAVASRERRFRPVPGIGEERYPAYCAVPLRAGRAVTGVLVLQREAPFDDDDVLLATAISGAFAHAIERASVRRRRVRDAPPRNRSVRLVGIPVVWGTALGVAQALPSFDSLGEGADAEDPDAAGLGEVWLELQKEISRGRRKRAPGSEDPELESILSDARLAHAIVSACASMGIEKGARSVAGRYVIRPEALREADEATADLLSRRAREVSDLCLLFAVMASPQARLFAARGGILMIPEAPSRVLALMALNRTVGAVLVGGPVGRTDPAIDLLARGGIPVVAEIENLFSWVEAGDRVLVDGTTGRVRVHPTPLEVIRARRGTKTRG